MRKSNLINFFLILIFFTGLSLLLYPSFSDYWNSLRQSKAVATYAEDVAHLENTQYDEMLAAAYAYNEQLRNKANPHIISDEEHLAYSNLLNLSGYGIMGYIEIPSIKCSLPIYHGVDDSVLQVAIGHIEWSSLPVGGEGTHSVVSGHRGLPSAKLFTDLDQLEPGDLFYIRVLDETLSYEVDQILIVEPHEVDSLAIQPGEDLCTLVTCTPYGINSHRLLVRGHRVENSLAAAAVRVTADAIQIEPLIVAPIVATPLLFLLLLMVLFQDNQNTKKHKKQKSHGGDINAKSES